jgi:uncharacterized protein
MNPLLLGALTGAAFGAVLMLSGLSNPRLIIDMLRLKDLRLLKLLVTAIAAGIVGVALLDALGAAHLGVKPLRVIAVTAGGIIFGVGFALSGYCPGTSLAGAAEGRRDALFVVAGGLLGTAVFAFSYAGLRPILVEPLSFGAPTVHSWLGVPGLVVALPIGAVAGWVVWRWLRAARHGECSCKDSVQTVRQNAPEKSGTPT